LRVFGAPADDPNLHRLHALATESRGLWPESHLAWQNFLKDVAQSPQAWPGDIGKHVQALIWSRMAENAGSHRPRQGHTDNPLFDYFAERPEPLKPSAEQCLENAIKLAPDRVESYHALFHIYRENEKPAKAKKIALDLLKRCPGDFEMLNSLAGLYVDTQEYKQALEYLEKAIHANPLDRMLPGILAIVRQRWGLQLTLDGKYEPARAQFEDALKIWPGPKTTLLCQWAICELKAKNPTRAEELIAQSLAAPDQRLAVRYALVGESIRAKLPAAEKKRIAADLKAALAEAPTPAEIIVLIQGAAQQHLVHDDAFHGQKTQEKTILKFLDQIHFDAFDENQITWLVKDLQTLEARKPWLNCLNYGRRKFLKNALLRLSFVDYYLLEKTANPKTHLAREHLDAARKLVEHMPRGEEQQRLLDAIQEKEEFIAHLQSRNRGMMDVFDRIFGDEPGPFDDDDDFF
jgi:Tfp pilus assembly protein PilF